MNIVADTLAKFVDIDAIAEIQPRETQSASFLLHVDYVDSLLKNSGKDGLYIKERKGCATEMELLWLPPDFTMARALEMSKDHDDVFGATKKGPPLQTRIALRFRSLQTLSAFASTHKLDAQALLGRWKLTGTHVSVGLHGALALLTAQSWQDIEVLHVAENQAVFLASNVGNTEPCHNTYLGVQRQLRCKALNSKARDMLKQANQSSAAASSTSVASHSAKPLNVSHRQKEFLQKVESASKSRTAPPMQVSPKKDSEKRKTEVNSGLSPDEKRSRDQQRPS